MPEKGNSKNAKEKDRDEDSRDNKDGSNDNKDNNQKDSNKKESDSGGDGRTKQKEYFKEELRRLQENLDKEKAKIVEPEKKDFTPNIFNKLEPYYNTEAPQYLIELPDQERHGYVSRQTAIGLCDPWIDLRMDVELLPKVESKAQSGEKDKKKSTGTPRTKEGSTHLPKFPHVCVTTDDLTKNKKIYYDEVPALREELKKKYSSEAGERIDTEYKRTKQDFYRMELDKMDEYHPSAKPKMKATYFAYLQNNAGAKRAVYECVRETEAREKKEQEEKEKEKKEKEEKEKKSGKKQKKDGKDGKDNKKDNRPKNTSNTRNNSSTNNERSQNKK